MKKKYTKFIVTAVFITAISNPSLASTIPDEDLSFESPMVSQFIQPKTILTYKNHILQYIREVPEGKRKLVTDSVKYCEGQYGKDEKYGMDPYRLLDLFRLFTIFPEDDLTPDNAYKISQIFRNDDTPYNRNETIKILKGVDKEKRLDVATLVQSGALLGGPFRS